MLMVEWTSNQFSFYNERINDLMGDFNAATSEEEQGQAMSGLIELIDTFAGIGRDDIADLQSAEPTRIRALSTRLGIPLEPDNARALQKLVRRYEVNITTLENMKRAILSGDLSDLWEYAGSMKQMAFPKGQPANPAAPFMVLMGFLTNMQLRGLGQGVIRTGRRFEGKENEACPVCESELCRCCPDCEQPECKCEEDAADRIKMISDFIPEDL
jgi:hypothetical protein